MILKPDKRIIKTGKSGVSFEMCPCSTEEAQKKEKKVLIE